jgi:hypothetical protein
MSRLSNGDLHWFSLLILIIFVVQVFCVAWVDSFLFVGAAA